MRAHPVKCSGGAAILTIDWLDGTNVMSERFTETLRAASEPSWSHAVGHRFVTELFTGAVPDTVMARVNGGRKLGHMAAG